MGDKSGFGSVEFLRLLVRGGRPEGEPAGGGGQRAHDGRDAGRRRGQGADERRERRLRPLAVEQQHVAGERRSEREPAVVDGKQHGVATLNGTFKNDPNRIVIMRLGKGFGLYVSSFLISD